MDILDQKTSEELHRALIVELAKAKNELACARSDLDKVTNRLGFLLVIANKLIDRKGD
jgi:hypothetical protein